MDTFIKQQILVITDLTNKKKDFWFDNEDGSFTKHQRGPVKGFKGEWRPRARKHRYLLVYDSNFKM